MYSNVGDQHEVKSEMLDNKQYIKQIMEIEIDKKSIKVKYTQSDLGNEFVNIWKDSNNNNEEGFQDSEEVEKPKPYYWKTVERDGIKYNTLKYKHSQSLESQVSETASETPSKGCCQVCQENCCTIFLIFLIFVLVGVVIFLSVWCFYLENSLQQMKIKLYNMTLPRNYELDELKSTTDGSLTFFPGWIFHMRQKFIDRYFDE